MKEKKEKIKKEKPKKEKVVHEISVDALDSEQKIFIENKVKELGSFEKVKAVYNQKSSVCFYAHQLAAELYQK